VLIEVLPSDMAASRAVRITELMERNAEDGSGGPSI
jgi:hypothetical protein